MDYSKIGLKCGLEVHQQLDTGKLFCRCPSLLKEGKPDFVFQRKLRLAASELGEFDPAAVEQYKKDLTYEYNAFSECCCLVEADEEPPKQPNKKALETALKIALMSDSRVFDQLFAMRKTVIDGSNTSGFQRTMLIAEGGNLKVGEKRVGIQTIVLEEDASRPIEKTKQKVVYSLDRQGIPLIEIATAPELFSPGEVQECAKKLGELLRRTCKAKRGLGSIRQDINISIGKGARIELKGVQELGMIKEYVKREVQRQLGLVEIKKELKKRRIKEKDLNEKEMDASKALKKTKCKFVKSALKKGKKAIALKLKGFKGLVGKELQPKRRFGTELADYIKARHGLKGLIHSDELPKYGVSEREREKIAKKLNCKKNDAFVLVIGTKSKAKKAFNTIRERCQTALNGVPEETRNALENGNSTYSRPLPGAARMYPETDLKTVKVEKEWLNELKGELPLTVQERLKLYKKHSLSSKLAEEMKLSNFACFFKELLEKGFDATTSAVLLLEGLKKLKREGVNTEKLTKKDTETLLKAEKDRELSKNSLLDAIKAVSRGSPVKQAIESYSMKKIDSQELEKKIQKIVKENSKLVEEKGEYAVKALMGEAMKRLKGKASGKKVMKLLKKNIQKKLKE